MTRQLPSRQSRPIAASHVDNILRNRYYLCFVKFEGIEYPGQHQPLVTERLFQELQRVRAARIQSGEKPRVLSSAVVVDDRVELHERRIRGSSPTAAFLPPVASDVPLGF
jgi:hypothetical protein